MAYPGIPCEIERVRQHLVRQAPALPHTPRGGSRRAPWMNPVTHHHHPRDESRQSDDHSQQRSGPSARAATPRTSRTENGGAKPRRNASSHPAPAGRVPARTHELLSRSQREVLSFAPYDDFSGEHLARYHSLVLEALRRGVRYRLITRFRARDGSPTARYVREITHQGAEVRVTSDASDRLLVSDRREAVLSLGGGGLGEGALFTRETGTVATIVGLFERAWEQAEPYVAAGAAGVPAGAREVLAAMCSGDTDEAAARTLGYSVRTYRRRIAHLMRRLGANSRAQAALLARDRGWI